MSNAEEIIGAMRREMWPFLVTAMEGVLTKARGMLEVAEQRRTHGLAEVVEERTKGLAEVVKERAKGLAELDIERIKGLAEVAVERANLLAEVDARKLQIGREVAAMHMHKEAQEGRVELNIGGYRFETSVQTLRRVPHTFFDAYFSGRYAQDVCRDGSIFVDRDGEHFAHVLEYMRDGVVSVAEPGARPSVSLLRALKREFGFYCIELVAEQSAEPEQLKTAYIIGGVGAGRRKLSSMEMERCGGDGH
jgi:hypothetical protein